MVIEGFRKRSIKEGHENRYYSAWSLKVDLGNLITIYKHMKGSHTGNNH